MSESHKERNLQEKQAILRLKAGELLARADPVTVIMRLLDRLEMGYGFDADGRVVEVSDVYDGIVCRDASIAMLQEAVDEANRALSDERRAGFLLGMEEAAKLLDQEVASAKSVLAESTGQRGIDRVEGIRDGAESMARTIRHFATADEWITETLKGAP